MKAFFTSCNYLISKVNLFQKFIFLCHCACIPSTTLRNLVTIMVTCPLRRNCTSRGFVWIATYLNEIRSAKIWLDERQGVFNCRIGLLRPIAKNPFFFLREYKELKILYMSRRPEREREWHKEGSYFLPFEENEKMGLICDMFGIFNLSLLLYKS